MDKNLNIKNKKAYFEYEILDKYVAGLQLLGTEIKSIKEGKVSLREGYCFVEKGEAFVKNIDIAEYTHGNRNNHDPKRTRKLLLNKQEIGKIQKKLKDKGLTLIPLKLFIGTRGFAKLEIGIGKGKKIHDKRNSIKDKDVKRDLDRRKL